MLIIKGIVIGIGKIIPGVSGSMLAISMGVYEKLLNSINSFFVNPKKNFKFLFKISLGILISILLFSNIIVKSLDNYYTITMMLFIGLIIGSMELFKIQYNKLIVIISFLIPTFISLCNSNNEVHITNSILNTFYYVIMGFVDAITMVVPGVSGTATLMILGCYENIIYSFSNIFNSLNILIPFFIGLIIGIVIMVKIVSFLFKKYSKGVYSSIVGFAFSSILIMFILAIESINNISDIFIGLIFLLIGFLISKKINHFFD